MTKETLNKPKGLEIFDSGYVPSDIRLVLRLQALIEQEFRYEHGPEFYAAKLKLTIRRLNSLTKSYLDKTVYELIQERIHEEVIKLLTHTKLTAKQITYEVGISNPSYFSRCFRKIMGLSPKEYRRVIK